VPRVCTVLVPVPRAIVRALLSRRRYLGLVAATSSLSRVQPMCPGGCSRTGGCDRWGADRAFSVSIGRPLNDTLAGSGRQGETTRCCGPLADTNARCGGFRITTSPPTTPGCPRSGGPISTSIGHWSTPG